MEAFYFEGSIIFKTRTYEDFFFSLTKNVHNEAQIAKNII